MFEHYVFPDHYTAAIEKILKTRGHSVEHPQALADAVRRLSDHFTSPGLRRTPWDSSDVTAAYMAYFFPLNYLRLLRVIEHARGLGFFSGLDHLIDFGAGPGTTSLAMTDTEVNFRSQTLVELNEAPRELFERLCLGQPPSGIQWRSEPPGALPASSSLVAACFALHELESWPQWLEASEALLFVYPSGRDPSRRLGQTRAQLIERGFSIWAPCVHQRPCPVLTHSKSDFCHERIHIEMPGWFRKMESFLPMRNRTITFSYLLARKTARPPGDQPMLRVLGDTLKQKGKTLQMICRGEEREFLSWLSRDGEAPILPSGELIPVPPHNLRGSELRVIKD